METGKTYNNIKKYRKDVGNLSENTDCYKSHFFLSLVPTHIKKFHEDSLIKRPARDACLCMGELQAPPAPHFVFLITL